MCGFRKSDVLPIFVMLHEVFYETDLIKSQTLDIFYLFQMKWTHSFCEWVRFAKYFISDLVDIFLGHRNVSMVKCDLNIFFVITSRSIADHSHTLLICDWSILFDILLLHRNVSMSFLSISKRAQDRNSQLYERVTERSMRWKKVP